MQVDFQSYYDGSFDIIFNPENNVEVALLSALEAISDSDRGVLEFLGPKEKDKSAVIRIAANLEA